jgi:hypothetical protein
MRLNKRTRVKLRNIGKRSVSLFLAFAIIFQVTMPTQVFALTGGPSQPEVQSFEPIATSDMVDLFSGDFNYNIPLLDVEGYPINIAYHSGVGMDQEASWVGLGWNINPGVINRNMRGLPDDFSGDNVTKELNIKDNKTWGVAADVSLEVYGYDAQAHGTNGSGSVTVGSSFAFNYNNYTGPSITQGMNLSLGVGNSCGGVNASLGINSSSDEGLTIAPSVGFSAKIKSGDNASTSLGMNVGTAFNSRGGMKQLTISASASVSYNSGDKKVVEDENGNKSVEDNAGNARTSSSMGSGSVGGTFDFGTPTSTPSITYSMKNHSFFGKFTLGGEVFGLNGKVGVSGSYACQKLAQKSITSPAYGYLYSENGQENDHALMDFNREKDGSYNENMAALPIANYTFDTYSVSGQGVGGSYRPFRSDVGYMFDPSGYTTSDDGVATVELGLGNLFHLGVNVSVTNVTGTSGKWKDNNNALSKLRFSSKGNGNDYENVYFKEANEKTVDDDPSFYADAGYDAPVSPSIDFSSKYEPVLNGFGPVKRKKRAKRTQNFYFLKRSEYNDFAVENIADNYVPSDHHTDGHIAEVTTLATDGSRYIYGIAAYNTMQKEVTFAIGSPNPTSFGDSVELSLDANKGLIGYKSSGSNAYNSTNNNLGIDNFYSGTTTPAYSHSYLLTSVLSADYIDADSKRGPSDGDFGSYTRFAYKKNTIAYKWRTPFEAYKASYTEGLKSDLQDDKANYIYGEKELWYLDSVITKNYVAVFHKSDRYDAIGVNGENGGAGPGRMKRLDSISLYSKADLNAQPTTALPIKRVHFVYSYDLCNGVPNVTGGKTGKLTLKQIYFSYQNSNKARLSPYTFDYHERDASNNINLGENPNYNLKGYDRWGNYKPNTATATGVKNAGDVTSFISGAMPTSDFPYVEQNQAIANEYSSVWSLKEIHLPSGGTIKMTYESDDYAYVQNKKAMQMFKIVNCNSATDASNTLQDLGAGLNPFSSDKFYFELQKDSVGDTIKNINYYIDGIDKLYFRFLVQIRDFPTLYNHLEYVSGYGEIDKGAGKCGVTGGLGYISFKEVGLEPKKPGFLVNPIIKTAVQYARLYLAPKAFTLAPATSFSEGAAMEQAEGLSTSILEALINSSFIKNIKDAILGPNYSLYVSYNVAQKFVAGKSWIRLQNPSKQKFGGGSRIKKIEIIDEWADMTNGNSSETSNYGQQYEYKLEEGGSSGVASYEPQLGGDENPFRQPVPYDVKKLMVPNDEFYQEEPFGESFFPSPSIGYSRVTVKNIYRKDVTKHATGKVVHEFYTAKDYPTIVRRSSIIHKRAKDDPFSIRSLLKINVRDYLTAAQGFVIELNDMHGKPKSQAVYQEGHTSSISSVSYYYKDENYADHFRLKNNCTTIAKDGTVSTNTIGEFFDMVADIRESKSTINNVSVGVNIDQMFFGVIPAIVPSAWPSFSKQKTRFRSATTTKVIQRFGILDETIAKDLTSEVSKKDIAYDAQTGAVLLTETSTNFDDKVYSLKYPAWWYYESMGPAYQNIGFEVSNILFTTGSANVGSMTTYFREGDELALKNSNPAQNKKGWVKELTASNIIVVDKAGNPVNGTYTIKVIRSGKRNTMVADMATITTLSDPTASIQTNVYENVLQASAVEYSNKRQTHCNCLGNENTTVPYTTNPYVMGTAGNWRPSKSHTHLTNRSQSNYDNNTNIRKDGVFTSYFPFYKYEGSKWEKDGKDWTYVSEVTAFTVLGEELENKDALGRYSSATFGYNQSQALSVAANSQYKEQGFDGFEDYSFNPCADDHFKFAATPTTAESHTGRYSLKVSSGLPKTLVRQLTENCEPTNDCNVTIKLTLLDGYRSFSFPNAVAPVSVSWNIISGNPPLSLTNTSLNLYWSADPYEFEFTVVDKNGCSVTQTITN